MQRIGPTPSIRRLKLLPMLVAPFLSRLRGSMQSRCVQRRSPLNLLPISASFSSHGPHGERQRQHVFDVYASGVGDTTESTCELPHKSDADARRVAPIASGACLSGHHSPRPVRKHDRPRVSLFSAHPQAACTASPLIVGPSPPPSTSSCGVQCQSRRRGRRPSIGDACRSMRRTWPGRMSVSCSRRDPPLHS